MKTIYLKALNNPQLSTDSQVFASPAILLFFNGKDSFRFSKYVSVSELIERIDRYNSMIFK